MSWAFHRHILDSVFSKVSMKMRKISQWKTQRLKMFELPTFGSHNFSLRAMIILRSFQWYLIFGISRPSKPLICPLEINVNIGMSQKCGMLGSQTLRTGACKAYPRHACLTCSSILAFYNTLSPILIHLGALCCVGWNTTTKCLLKYSYELSQYLNSMELLPKYMNEWRDNLNSVLARRHC